VKRASAIRWFLVASLVVAATAIAYFSLSKNGGSDDPSIVLTEPFRTVHGRVVENGSVFDRAAVKIGTSKMLVLPHDAIIRRKGAPGEVQLFMKKTLEFAGHPPEPMSVRDARRNMGCAVKVDGHDLLIATFGEWDSHIEGSAQMKLVVNIAHGVEFEMRKGFSGENSAGHDVNEGVVSMPQGLKGGYWYGPTLPAQGWTAVPDVPDPDRTAQ